MSKTKLNDLSKLADHRSHFASKPVVKKPERRFPWEVRRVNGAVALVKDGEILGVLTAFEADCLATELRSATDEAARYVRHHTYR